MKYIVYCTTNLKNNKTYIGVHKTNNPNVFDGYIGNGVKVPLGTERKFHINSADSAFKHAVNKYGYKNFYRSTLAVFDDEQQAYDLEKQLVTKEFVSRKDNYNTALGGVSGIVIDNRPVIQLSVKEDEIKCWDSITEAALEMGLRTASIRSACEKISTTSGGYIWKYALEKDRIDGSGSSKLKRVASNKGDTNAIPIVQYSKTGYRIHTFKSVAEAASHVNIPSQNISACCNSYINNKSSGGYQWRFESDNIDVLPPLEITTQKKSVLKLLNGEIIEEFDGAKSAAISINFPNASREIRKRCVDGREYKGFTWQFKG